MLSIGDVARLVGTSERAIRHYEAVGLVPDPERAANGYRVYRAADVVRLLAVVRLRDAGLGLDEIRDVLGGGPEAWQEALVALGRAIEREQAALDLRRERLAELREQSPDPVLPAGFAPILERFAAAGMSSELVAAEREAILLASVADPGALPALLAHYEQVVVDPDRLRADIDLAGRFAALAAGPATPDEIEALAHAFLDRLRESPVIGPTLGDADDPGAVSRAVRDLMRDHLETHSSAQRALFARLEDLVREEVRRLGSARRSPVGPRGVTDRTPGLVTTVEEAGPPQV